ETLALGTANDGVVLVEWPDGSERMALRQTGARAMAFRPDGTLLATLTESKLVTLWDLSQPKARKTVLRGHEDTARGVAFSPDGTLLATAGQDGAVVLWDPAARQERARFDWKLGPAYAVAFAPDGMTMAVGGDEGVVLADVDAPR